MGLLLIRSMSCNQAERDNPPYSLLFSYVDTRDKYDTGKVTSSFDKNQLVSIV